MNFNWVRADKIILPATRIWFETIQASTERDNEVMRRRILDPAPPLSDSQESREWLKLQEMAEVEVTSATYHSNTFDNLEQGDTLAFCIAN